MMRDCEPLSPILFGSKLVPLADRDVVPYWESPATGQEYFIEVRSDTLMIKTALGLTFAIKKEAGI